MKIGILGGGVAGLSCALFLTRAGHEVSLFEATEELGGLASSFPLDGSHIERYYHFICKADKDLQELCRELGLTVIFKPTRMAFFHDGSLYPFGTPWELLQFKPLSLLERLNFGINVLHARSIKYWQALEPISAKEWLISQLGKRAYEVIWHPLLKIKFGPYSEQISASWIWHRIHRVATSRSPLMGREQLGYIEGGTKALITALQDALISQGCQVLLNLRVEGIEKDQGCWLLHCSRDTYSMDAVVSALPLPIFASLLPESFSKYKQSLERISFIAVVCVVLKLSHPFSEAFWLNINDPRIAFNGIIEYTNLNPCPQFKGSKIIYIPYYLLREDERFSMPDGALLEEYTEALKLINPNFEPSWIEASRVFRDDYAQAICTTHFSSLVPSMKTPFSNLYLLDSTQLYPADRTISGMIGLARKVAEEIENRRKGA